MNDESMDRAELVALLMDDTMLIGPEDKIGLIRRDNIEELTFVPPDNPPSLSLMDIDDAYNELIVPTLDEAHAGDDPYRVIWINGLLLIRMYEYERAVVRFGMPPDDTESRRMLNEHEAKFLKRQHDLMVPLIEAGRALHFSDEDLIEAVGGTRRDGVADANAAIELAVKRGGST